MYLIRARFEIARPEIPTLSFPTTLEDCLYQTDGVQHFHIARDESGVNVTLFVIQPTLLDAEEIAMEICVRCLASAGTPGQWRLTQCTADVIGLGGPGDLWESG
jgi:hypothetical protein